MELFLLQFLFLQLVSLVTTQALVNQTISTSSSASAVFVFGDSLVDAGNNNYLETYTRSNFPPYGVDFVNHSSTGRFSNGKIMTDFISSYLGIKELIPPYLDSTLSMQEFITGVTFASAGAGFDPLTSSLITLAIPMEKQLEYFTEYKIKLESIMGPKRARTHIRNAIFIVVAGANDVGIVGQRVLKFDRPIFQVLWHTGARRIGVFGALPLGSLPVVITIRKEGANFYNIVTTDYNVKLHKELALLQKKLNWIWRYVHSHARSGSEPM